MATEALEKLAESIGMPTDEAAKAFSRFQLYPITVAGQVVGAYMVNGPEIHVGVADEGRKRWCTRRLLREALKPIFDEYGYVYTKVRQSHEYGKAFVERLGFERINETDEVIEYVLSTIR